MDPNTLAGFSLGGLIAFEMAQQLLQCGEKVELVALVDSQLDEQCLTFPAWLAHQRSRAALELREIRARPWRQSVSYIFAKDTLIYTMWAAHRRRKSAKALRFQ